MVQDLSPGVRAWFCANVVMLVLGVALAVLGLVRLLLADGDGFLQLLIGTCGIGNSLLVMRHVRSRGEATRGHQVTQSTRHP